MARMIKVSCTWNGDEGGEDGQRPIEVYHNGECTILIPGVEKEVTPSVVEILMNMKIKVMKATGVNRFDARGIKADATETGPSAFDWVEKRRVNVNIIGRSAEDDKLIDELRLTNRELKKLVGTTAEKNAENRILSKVKVPAEGANDEEPDNGDNNS